MRDRLCRVVGQKGCERPSPYPVATFLWYTVLIMERNEGMVDNIDVVGQEAIYNLAQKHAARERALPKSRAAIRYCANSIRAAHRHEFRAAEDLVIQASALLAEMATDLRDHQ